MVQGGMKCIKYILFLFNLVFFIAGLVLIIAGTLIQTKFNADFAFFEGSAVNHVALVLIGVGVVIFTVAFFGCCGAYKENHCMVLTFSILLGFVFIVELGGAVTAHIMRGRIDELIRTTMTKTSKTYPKGKALKEAWDHIQKDFECCGVSNYTDWELNPHYNDSVPDSCCIEYKPECGKSVISTGLINNIYTEGCADRFLEASALTIIVVICIAVGVAIMQILGIALACFLAESIRNDNYQRL